MNMGQCATFKLIEVFMVEFLGLVEGSFDLDNRTGSVGAAVVVNFPPTDGAAMEATPSVMMTEDVLRWIVNTDFATENIFLDLARNLMPGRVEETHVDGGKSVSGSRPTFFLPVRQLRGFDLDPARHVNCRTRMNRRRVCRSPRRFILRKNSSDVWRGS
jgi:hypothetical protein